MCVLRSQMSKRVCEAKSVCNKWPRSNSCKIAWDRVDELSEHFCNVQNDYLLEMNDQVGVELDWKNEEDKDYM